MSYTAYVAQPIDQARHYSRELQKVADRITTDLTAHGYCVYRPSEAWRVPAGAPACATVEAANRMALGRADLLVAYLPANVPTIGVPMEIEHALALDIPVIAVVEPEVTSYALQRDLVTRIDGVLEGQLAQALNEVGDVVDWSRRLREAPRITNDTIQLVIRDGHELPQRVYADDAGLDLTTVQDYVINPGKFVDVHTQVDAVQLPDGHWGMITGRSSALRRWGLFVPTGVIDPGWRGPLFIGVWNLGPDPVKVEPGMRLGQLILMANNPAPVYQVGQVQDAPRGTHGFGSSG